MVHFRYPQWNILVWGWVLKIEEKTVIIVLSLLLLRNFPWLKTNKQTDKKHRKSRSAELGDHSVKSFLVGLFWALMLYFWLIVCSCFNHSIRNVLVLVGKCAMCSKFKALFLKSRPCQFLWFIRKLTNVTFSYKPILIINKIIRVFIWKLLCIFSEFKALRRLKPNDFQLSDIDMYYFLPFFL